jgi:hypothetical protein
MVKCGKYLFLLADVSKGIYFRPNGPLINMYAPGDHPDGELDARGARTVKQLEDMAAEIFNGDPELQQLGARQFDSGKEWRDEFLSYGCYCNNKMDGGGKVPWYDNKGELVLDPNDQGCFNLYRCYRCIAIDFDHEKEYAAMKMAYSHEISNSTMADGLEITCTGEYLSKNKDKKNKEKSGEEIAVEAADFEDEVTDDVKIRRRRHHDHDPSNWNCPRSLCECDKQFIMQHLERYKQCLRGDESHCYQEEFLHKKPHKFDKQRCFEPMEVLSHPERDACCGDYPNRVPYTKAVQTCCKNSGPHGGDWPKPNGEC